MQIDAQEVYQPINPGDGRIGKFEYLGAAPKTRNWVKLDEIHLETSIKERKDVGTITVQNKGKAPIEIFSQELALTLLKKQHMSEERWRASDGPSFALITRQSFEIGGSTPRWQAKGVENGEPYSWTIGQENALPHAFILAPEEKSPLFSPDEVRCETKLGGLLKHYYR